MQVARLDIAGQGPAPLGIVGRILQLDGARNVHLVDADVGPVNRMHRVAHLLERNGLVAHVETQANVPANRVESLALGGLRPQPIVEKVDCTLRFVEPAAGLRLDRQANRAAGLLFQTVETKGRFHQVFHAPVEKIVRRVDAGITQRQSRNAPLDLRGKEQGQDLSGRLGEVQP
jgi:hypothetical protein